MIMLEKQPGISLLKNYQSEWCSCSNTLRRLVGIKQSTSLKGITDYDIKPGIANLADQLLQQDRQILDNKLPLTVLHFIRNISDDQMQLLLGKKHYIEDKETNFVGIYATLIDITTPFSIYFANYLEKLHKKQNQSEQFTLILDNNNKKLNLTKREEQCLFLITVGKTNKEIARSLNLSYKTIDTYVENLKEKLNCKTKYALVEKIFKNKIVHCLSKAVLM